MILPIRIRMAPIIHLKLISLRLYIVMHAACERNVRIVVMVAPFSW
jgi:hypothetical protein